MQDAPSPDLTTIGLALMAAPLAIFATVSVGSAVWHLPAWVSRSFKERNWSALVAQLSLTCMAIGAVVFMIGMAQ